MLQLQRIPNHDFESALSEVKAAFRFGNFDPKAVRIFHQRVLLNYFVAILEKHTFDRRQHAFLSEVVIVVWSKDQFHFVPAETSAWNLFEEARGGLKNDRSRENDHSACRLRVRCRSTEFHQVQSNEADIDDVPRHSRDLDPIAHPD